MVRHAGLPGGRLPGDGQQTGKAESWDRLTGGAHCGESWIPPPALGGKKGKEIFAEGQG